jgi:hypothetical protein
VRAQGFQWLPWLGAAGSNSDAQLDMSQPGTPAPAKSLKQSFAFARGFTLSRAIGGDTQVNRPVRSPAFDTAQSVSPPASCRGARQSHRKVSGMAATRDSGAPRKIFIEKNLTMRTPDEITPISDGYRPDLSGKCSSYHTSLCGPWSSPDVPSGPKPDKIVVRVNPGPPCGPFGIELDVRYFRSEAMDLSGKVDACDTRQGRIALSGVRLIILT